MEDDCHQLAVPACLVYWTEKQKEDKINMAEKTGEVLTFPQSVLSYWQLWDFH